MYEIEEKGHRQRRVLGKGRGRECKICVLRPAGLIGDESPPML